MKILELRFKNLNSLYGEWFIDFTSPEYLSSGIFALTGPTGAGKTTILDAICLALYGTTPRLGKLTGSNNDLMSTQTGDCYAELVFESQFGRYRCRWSQHRARLRADGKLSNAKHEISDAVCGRLIEAKKSLVQNVIREKTGMDFERFTRSILLAQGDFDAFLKADVEQKSKILEQITGTEIYSEISRCVHEKQREEKDRLIFLQDEKSGIAVMESRQEEEILHNLSDRKKLKIELSKKCEDVDADLAYLTSIKNLENDISLISDRLDKLKLENQAFAPKRKRLALSMKAAELDGDYASLESVRRQQEDDEKAMGDAQKSLPELQYAYNQIRARWKSAEEEIQTAKERLEEATPTMRRTRSLDQRIMEIEKRMNICMDDCRRDEIQIRSDEELREQELGRYDEVNESLEVSEEYLAKNSADKWLVSNLATVESQLDGVLTLQEKIEGEGRKERELREALLKKDIELEQNSVQVKRYKQAVDGVRTAREEAIVELEGVIGKRGLREYRLEKEALFREATFLARIEELEDQRAQLEDGKPCPLCGATEHPFAKGKTPKPTELDRKIAKLTETIEKAEEWESKVNLLKERESESREKLTENEKFEISIEKDRKSLQENLVELSRRLKNTGDDLSVLGANISGTLRPLGLPEISSLDIGSLRNSLQQRQKKWLAVFEEKDGFEKEISEIKGEIRRLDAVSGTRVIELKKKEVELKRYQSEKQSALNEREEIFGDGNVDTEESRFNKAISNAEREEKKLRIVYNSAKEKLTAISSKIASLEEDTSKRASKIVELGSLFSKVLTDAGFASELGFRNSRLTRDERSVLRSTEEKLDKQVTELQIRKKDRKAQLEVEKSKVRSKATLEEMQALRKEFKELLERTRKEIAELESRLSENDAAKGRVEEKKTIIEAQKRECDRWEKLHVLIGSADGKKYRNFAQGLTFELLLNHANRQLAKLSDRYLLIHDKEHPLSTNVIDAYQADEIRPIKNLSGGESFIASLALALGLSKMSSKKVRVDSLFLDEGFGTLDEDSLETALEFISGLRQDGKLIGIISHLPQLNDCIKMRITVTRLHGGRSILSGPGCSAK